MKAKIQDQHKEKRISYGRYNEILAINDGKVIDSEMANSEQFAPLSLDAYVNAVRDIVIDGKKSSFLAINLYPTLNCNNNCPHCFADKNVKDESQKNISLDILEKNLDNLAQVGVKNVRLLGGGEATIYSDFTRLLQALSKREFVNTLITNGKNIAHISREVSEYVSLIRVSLDSADEKSRIATHGTNDFSIVMKGIDLLSKEVASRDDPYQTLGLTYMIARGNEHKVYDGAKIAKESGVHFISYRLPKGMKEDYFSIEERLRISEQLRQSRDDFGNHIAIMTRFNSSTLNPFSYSSPKDSQCLTKKLRFLMQADGKVQACNSYNYAQRWSHGNIYEQSLSDVFNSKKSKEILERELSVCSAGVCCLSHANEVFYFIAKNLRQTNGLVQFQKRYNHELE